MHIHFRQGKEALSDRELEKAEAKLVKLSRLLPERNYETQVYVDIDRESGSQNSERMWRSTIRLDVVGDRFTATEMGNTAEKALDLSIKEIKTELRKSKQKTHTIRKRGSSLIKRLFRGG